MANTTVGMSRYEQYGVIYTPHGLKIRLDPKRVDKVLKPTEGLMDIEDALTDVELWADLPSAISSVATILAAWLTRSWTIALLVFLIAYAAANLFQQFSYSRFLKLVFPQFLGSWPVSLCLSVACAVTLFRSGSAGTAVVQLVIVLGNWLGVTDVILFVLMPLRVGLKNLLGVKIGDVELALTRILESQAKRGGIALDWRLYDELQ